MLKVKLNPKIKTNTKSNPIKNILTNLTKYPNKPYLSSFSSFFSLKVSILPMISFRVKNSTKTGENRKFKKLQIIPRFYHVSTRKCGLYSTFLNFVVS